LQNGEELHACAAASLAAWQQGVGAGIPVVGIPNSEGNLAGRFHGWRFRRWLLVVLHAAAKPICQYAQARGMVGGLASQSTIISPLNDSEHGLA
jgi:hypothetical protein